MALRAEAATALARETIAAMLDAAVERAAVQAAAAAAHRQPQPRLTLEQRLWAVWRRLPRPKPSSKEMNESFAFFKRWCRVAGRRAPAAAARRLTAVDCCGGHGILAMLLCAYRKAHDAVVIDLMQPPSFAHLEGAWRAAGLLPAGAAVRFERADVAAALPRTLAARGEARAFVVLACHACQFLTRDIVETCTDPAVFARGDCVPCAVMSCCHKDAAGRVKAAAAQVGVPLGTAMDLVLFGRMEERGLVCRMKTIDPGITPMNRILFVQPQPNAGGGGGGESTRQQEEEDAGRRQRLAQAYVAAHRRRDR